MALIPDPNAPIDTGSRQVPLVVIQIVLVSVAFVVYSLRLYTRSHLLRSLGSDDYIMGAAMLISIGLAVNACISTKYGWGSHISNIPTENMSTIYLCIWISELLFTLSTSFVKISILFFYLRLATTQTYYRKVIYGSIAFISAWLLAFGSLVIFQCKPVNAYWDPEATDCHSPEIALFLHGLTNTITDIYVYVLPMRLVWKIQLPKRQRIGLLALFGAGFLVCIAGALRLYYSIITQKSDDSPWEGFNLWTWESVEVNLGIVCASAPCLKTLIARVIPKFLSTRSDSKPASAANYLRERRNTTRARTKDTEAGYILDSVGEVERHGDRAGDRSESQDDLTNGREHISFAKVDRT